MRELHDGLSVDGRDAVANLQPPALLGRAPVDNAPDLVGNHCQPSTGTATPLTLGSGKHHPAPEVPLSPPETAPALKGGAASTRNSCQE